MKRDSFSNNEEKRVRATPKKPGRGKNTPAAQRLYALVKNFQGINQEVEVFAQETEALKSFREYTGFEWNPHYTNPESDLYDEDFSETKVFEVSGKGISL
jgi:hypothetical protein